MAQPVLIICRTVNTCNRKVFHQFCSGLLVKVCTVFQLLMECTSFLCFWEEGHSLAIYCVGQLHFFNNVLNFLCIQCVLYKMHPMQYTTVKHLFCFYFIQRHQECAKQYVITAVTENVPHPLEDKHSHFSVSSNFLKSLLVSLLIVMFGVLQQSSIKI